MRKTAPTLEDVAKAAGVSTATVSRCLNAPDKVQPRTREKVLQTVETLGYTPNFAARVMAAKRTHTIGAIIPTMENAIFARGLQAFQEALGEHGYTLLVSSSAYDPDIERQQIRALVSRGADGLLLIGHERDAGVYDYLRSQNIPALAAWSFETEGQIPSIGFDNRAAMRALAEIVLNKGHRQLAMISAPTRDNDRARLRLQGVLQAVHARGLRLDSVDVIETPYTIDNGESALHRLMDGPRPPTAVICGNDVLAVGAVRGALKRGLKVPQDLSVTGFDDIELSEIVTPQLTTVHVPHRDMGRTAAKALVAMVEGQDPPKSQQLPTRVVLRASLAAPAEKD